MWIDVDKDGVHDAGEATMGGVPVELVPTAGPPGKVQRSAARVSIEPSAGTTGQVVTGPDGTYAFEAVLPGAYTVLARLSGAGISPWWDSDGTGDWTVSVTVPVGTATADLAAVGAGAVNGQVYFASTQQGVAAAQVRCAWSGVDGVLGTADDGVFTVDAGVDGAFTLANAPYGTYSCAGVDPVTGAPSAPVRAYVEQPDPAPIRMPIGAPGPHTVPVQVLPRAGAGTSTLFKVAWSLMVAGLGVQWVLRSRVRRTLQLQRVRTRTRAVSGPHGR